MITKFTQIKHKRILICIVDNTERCDSSFSREINVNLSDFMVQRFDTRYFDIFIGEDEEELLKEACSDDYYTHAVIISSGTSFRLNDRIYPAIEELCKKDFTVAGHILDRGDSYYELHHQFYVMNLSEYKSMNMISLGQESIETHTQIEPLRSQECIFDDSQLPLWVKQGTVERTYTEKKHGWNLLRQCFLEDRVMIDIGEKARLGKKYLYYEHDHVFLRELQEIYYYQFFCNHAFFPFNTDALLKDTDFVGVIDQYVTVGTGLHWINNLLKFGFHDKTRVIFTDINLNCLNFMESLVKEWDGVDYVSFYLSKKPFKSTPEVNPDNYVDEWNRQWVDFVSQFDDWEEIWGRIRKLSYTFKHLDYTGKYDFNFIEPNLNTFINLSDLFNHVPYVSTQPLKYRIAAENRLIDRLQKRIPEATLLVTSRTSDGFEKEHRKERLAKVKDFQQTDINLLKKPSWHLKDWVSPRPLL